MGEQEHPVGQEPSGPQEPSTTSPITTPAAGQPERHRRGAAARKALTSRAAGWVVATALAGAVVALSVVLATGSSPSVVAVRAPFGAMGPVVVGPGGPARQIHARMGVIQAVPGGLRVVTPAKVFGPGGVQVAAPGWSWAISVPPGFGPGPGAGRIMSPFGSVAAGTVGSVSSSSFTLTGPGGQTVTVAEQSSTAYRKAGSPVAASAVTRGARVAVLGSLTGSKMSALVVAVLSG